MNKGFIHIYTGDGKGKTTAAIGQVIRALGHNYKILFIQFAKSSNFDIGELKILKNISPNLTIEYYGIDEFINKKNIKNEHILYAQKGWNRFIEALNSNKFDMIVLDELNIILYFKFLPIDTVVNTLKNHSNLPHIIITGRNAPRELIEIAELVSEIKLIKHPFNKGLKAIKGIEY